MIRKLIAFSLLLAIALSCSKTEEVIDYGPADQKTIEDYLAAHDLTAQSTASGLRYIIQNPGSTNHPGINSILSVNYTGYLTDGTVFDSSYPTGAPALLYLNSLVAGWQEGLPLIGAGGKIQLFIPSAKAYGTKGSGLVPANSVIIFDIGLVDFY